MASTTPCAPSCSTTLQTVNVPGPSGPSAVTTTSAQFTLPAIGGTVSITVGDSSWIKQGSNLFISDGSKWGNFVVITPGNPFTARFLGLVGDSASGNVASGAVVVSGTGDQTFPWDLDALTAFTDNSGGAKSDTIAANVANNIIVLGPFSMALLVNSQIWELAIPYGFKVNSITFRDDIAITTGAKAATFTTRINAVATTGGVVAVAGTYATGATQAGTAISGGNTGTAGQTLEAIVSGVTAFSEGYGHLELSVTNTDLAATIAAIAFKANQLRTALRHQ